MLNLIVMSKTSRADRTRITHSPLKALSATKLSEQSFTDLNREITLKDKLTSQQAIRLVINIMPPTNNSPRLNFLTHHHHPPSNA
jgi:hypothetical protein